MIIGSFDLGTKHLAFVMMDVGEEFEEILETRLDEIDGSVQATIDYLNTLNLDQCHVILIERQMVQNRKTFAIQHQMEMYLKLIYGSFKEIIIFSPKLKTELLCDYKLTTYHQRKKFTIEYASKANIDFIDGKKKDDIADAYCQIKAYIITLDNFKR